MIGVQQLLFLIQRCWSCDSEPRRASHVNPLALRISASVSLLPLCTGFTSLLLKVPCSDVWKSTCYLPFSDEAHEKHPPLHTWCSDCGNKVESTLSLRDCREASSSGLGAPGPSLEMLPGNNTNMPQESVAGSNPNPRN